MSRLVALLMLVLIGAGLSSSAIAQDSKDTEANEETVYDFEGDRVTGELVQPDGERIKAEDRDELKSLIEVRSNFLPEMRESVEDL